MHPGKTICCAVGQWLVINIREIIYVALGENHTSLQKSIIEIEIVFIFIMQLFLIYVLYLWLQFKLTGLKR